MGLPGPLISDPHHESGMKVTWCCVIEAIHQLLAVRQGQVAGCDLVELGTAQLYGANGIGWLFGSTKR